MASLGVKHSFTPGHVSSLEGQYLTHPAKLPLNDDLWWDMVAFARRGIEAVSLEWASGDTDDMHGRVQEALAADRGVWSPDRFVWRLWTLDEIRKCHPSANYTFPPSPYFAIVCTISTGETDWKPGRKVRHVFHFQPSKTIHESVHITRELVWTIKEGMGNHERIYKTTNRTIMVDPTLRPGGLYPAQAGHDPFDDPTEYVKLGGYHQIGSRLLGIRNSDKQSITDRLPIDQVL